MLGNSALNRSGLTRRQDPMRIIGRLCISLALAISASASTLVGVNFGNMASPSPANWTLIGSVGTVNNLVNTSGVATGVSISVSGSPLTYTGSAPVAATIPSDAPSLTNLQSNFYNNGGSLTAQFSGLTPNAYYSVYAIGIRFVGTMNQSVTITGSGAPLTFTQNGAADSIFINGSLASSTQTLESYAAAVEASASGTISVVFTAGPSSRYNVAGIALSASPVMSPTPLPSSALLVLVGLATGGVYFLLKRKRLAGRTL